MGIAGNVIARVGADTRPFRRGLQGAQRSLNQWQRGMNRSLNSAKFAMKAAAIAMSASMAIVAKNSIKTAMTFEASMQQINRLMGENANQFVNWANENSNAFNMSRAEAIKYGATFGNLISSISNDTAFVTKKTQDLLKSSAIVASATGRTIEDTMERIRSGMLGNTESIEDLGINVNVAMIESTQAFRRFAGDKSWRQLDFQTQSQIRLMAILEQASAKYGDEISQNTSSSLSRLTAILKDASLNLGNAFLPAINAILPTLTSFAIRLKQITAIIAEFSQTLFGSSKTQIETSKNAMDAAKSQIALGKATKKAGQEAKRGVAGFDEVNQLQQKISKDAESAETGIGAGGGTLGDVTGTGATGGLLSDDAKTQIQEFRDKFINTFEEIKGFLQTNKEPIIASLTAITTAIVGLKIAMSFGTIVTTLKAVGTVIGAIFAGISTPVLVIIGVISALAGAFTFLWRTNENFRNLVKNIWSGIKTFFVDLWNNVLVPFGGWLADVFVLAWDKVTKAAQWLYRNVLIPLGRFLKSFWNNVLVPVGRVLGDVLVLAFKTLSRVASSFWKKVLVPLGEFFGAIFQPLLEAISTIFEFLWKEILKPFGTYLSDIFTPIFEVFGEVLDGVWENVLKPVANFIADVFVVVFESAFDTIGEVIKDLEVVFVGLLNFITNVFKGDWKGAWIDIKNVFKGIVDTFVDIFKAPLNGIIDLLNMFINKVNNLKIDIPRVNIPGIGDFGGGTVGFSLNEIPRLARGGIVSSPTLSMVGEAGAEAVVPLENTSFVDTLSSAIGNAVISAMQFNQREEQNDNDLVLNIDSTEIARVLLPALNKENTRIGSTIIQTA